MPPNTPVPSAGDCYRFVLARDEIDVCMMGVRDLPMFEDNMKVLEKGPMTTEELDRMRAIGDHIYR
jgi:predicted aldo/keto reductase-like oxidoreductase